MSSRQEEKQRRRAEREAAEAAAARSAARKGRMQLALGGLVALAAIVIAVLVVSGASDGGAGASGSATSTKIPAQKETDLKTAAKAAKCELTTSKSEGRDHTTDPAQWKYKTNPPTSGTHDPVAAREGLYEQGNSPPAGMAVHALEHGFVDLQYKPGTPKATIDKLETLGSEPLDFGTEGYHVLVFQNTTKMTAAVAATAWTQSLTCPTMNDGVYDAVRAFRTEYTNNGPELFK